MEAHSFLSPLKPYLEAFTEHEPARRLELLNQGLIPEAEIWGPKRVFAGYVEISEKIEGFQKNWPDCRLVLASGVICFGNAGHFAKAIADSKNSVLASGYSVAELAPDGRISRILAFWGPAPVLPESWPQVLAAPTALGGESAA
jgi:hypothetical protein